MSIEPHPVGKPLAVAAPPTWGETAPAGQTAVVIRFILDQSVVTIPTVQLRRWEHTLGLPETLVILASNERIVVVGRELTQIRAALDLGRLCELRANFQRAAGARPGPRVERITIEPSRS